MKWCAVSDDNIFFSFQFPSMYSDTRRRALAYTLERFQTDEYGSVPLFLFGDFNFRADTKGVVKVIPVDAKRTASMVGGTIPLMFRLTFQHLSEGLNCSTTEGDTSTIEFRKEGEVVLTLGKKEFCHSDHQNLFSSKEGNWVSASLSSVCLSVCLCSRDFIFNNFSFGNSTRSSMHSPISCSSLVYPFLRVTHSKKTPQGTSVI